MRQKWMVILMSSVMLLSAHGVWAQNSSGKTTVQTQKVQGIWIDVRTPEEFKAGHLSQVLNIPVEQIGQQINKVSPNKNTLIHLYCRSGNRAEAAAQVLRQMGYKKVTNWGGYQDLLQQGFR